MNGYVTVGIIDSGVWNIPAERVLQAKRFSQSATREAAPTDAIPDQLGHGSVIARTILELAPTTDLLIAQIFQRKLVTTPNQVAAALNWLVSRDVRVVNMSFGLTRDRTVLRDACRIAAANGIIMVAATPVRGGRVYPASYPGVFAVTGDARCSPGQISYLGSEIADFGACVKSSDGSVSGASVGCGHVTGMIAGYVAGHQTTNRNELMQWLIDHAEFRGAESH